MENLNSVKFPAKEEAVFIPRKQGYLNKVFYCDVKIRTIPSKSLKFAS